MKKEILLLKLFAKADINKAVIDGILITEINWGKFLEEAFNHKVHDLVWFNIQKNQLLKYLPKYVCNLFDLHWKWTILKSNSYFKHIGEIATMLNKAGIPYAFIKGFDLIDKLYCNKSEYIRTFNDLDILVEPKHLDKIEKLFLDKGFVFGNYDFNENRVEPADRYEIMKMKMTSHQLYPLVKKVNYDNEGVFAGPINIDINFTIFDGGKSIPAISTERLLKTACIRKAFNGIEYSSLDIYYTFVQLVCHLYREAHTEVFIEQKNDISLQKFYDIYEYLMWAENKWDIRKLVEIIYDANLSESFWFVLFLTDILYETTFLSTILNKQTDYMEKYEDYILCFKERFQL